MFHLITGTPGSGKTLFVLSEVSKQKGRPVYYANIDELALDWTPLSDPFNYHDEVPNGSIVIIDEVQKVFPSRGPKVDVPPALRFIETHRHLGIDIYFLTQHPNFVDIHCRRLAGRHVHMVRPAGMQFAMQYIKNGLIERLDALNTQRDLDKAKFTFPSDVFRYYKSAELHTHKRRLPRAVFWLGVSALFFLFGLGYVLFVLLPDMLFDDDAVVAEQTTSDGIQDKALDLVERKIEQILPGGGRKDHPETLDSVISAGKLEAAKYVPVYQDIPWTMPAFLERARIEHVPQISSCYSYSVGTNVVCRCVTDQQVRVSMARDQCLALARDGVHRYFGDDRRDRNDRSSS